MSEKKQLKSPYNLDENEMLLLKNLVEGPGFQVLSKIVKEEVAKFHGLLESVETATELHRMQGRITGSKAILAIPYSLVKSKLREMVKDQS